MKNPRVSAAISAIAIVLVGSMMFSSSEAPSTAVSILQWVLLIAGIVGLIGSLMQIAGGR
jgi:hypothetical protein